MTTKEIAELVGKDYSTVSEWIEKASCDMQDIYCKVQEAKKTSRPADYEPFEVAAIIAPFMGDDAAAFAYCEAMLSGGRQSRP
jgi:hypothetical protein